MFSQVITLISSSGSTVPAQNQNLSFTCFPQPLSLIPRNPTFLAGNPRPYRRKARRKLAEDEMSVLDSREGNGVIPHTYDEREIISTSKTKWLKRKSCDPRAMKLFGVDLSPDNIAVAMVYFVQGVLGLARLAVSFYLKG